MIVTTTSRDVGRVLRRSTSLSSTIGERRLRWVVIWSELVVGAPEESWSTVAVVKRFKFKAQVLSLVIIVEVPFFVIVQMTCFKRQS